MLIKAEIIEETLFKLYCLVISEQVCSNFYSSLGMLERRSCADIYQINQAARGVSRDYWVNTTTVNFL